MTLDIPYRSIPQMFLERVARTPDGTAFGHPAADDSGPVWLTWAQVAERATAIAAGLRGLGVQAEDRVAILAGTRLDWVVADLGVMCAGAATTTVYPTTEPADTAFIVGDSGSRVVIAENPRQAAKVAAAGVTHVVLMDGVPDPEATPPQLTLAELEARGAATLATEPGLIERIVAAIGPDHLATLIYTSGTTGRPKGVELLHRGWCWEAVAQGELGLLLPGDLQYLWLPLSHSFGKSLLCGVIHVGLPTYVDGRVDRLIDNLAVIRPTIMCAPPRVYEKVYNRVVLTAQEAGGLKAGIFAWAVRTGRKKPGLRYAIAHRLVFAKLHARLGGRIRVLVAGAAAVSVPLGEFFAAAGLPISEGYGLTETSAGVFVNRPGAVRVGTCGTALGDVECRIDTDGEILLRGAPVMRGYHNLPAETAEAFTEDGFLRTGDIGELSADGYLTITDRKKDLVKTSGGKYIAPSYVEGTFKALCPYVSQAVVIGRDRNFCTMLVTLDPDAGGGAPEQGRALIGGYVDQLNAKLNPWETIKNFAVLPRELTIEDGELTPSLKIKRRVVEEHFAAEIERMYQGSPAQT